jgi:hypothetical protein
MNLWAYCTYYKQQYENDKQSEIIYVNDVIKSKISRQNSVRFMFKVYMQCNYHLPSENA